MRTKGRPGEATVGGHLVAMYLEAYGDLRRSAVLG